MSHALDADGLRRYDGSVVKTVNGLLVLSSEVNPGAGEIIRRDSVINSVGVDLPQDDLPDDGGDDGGDGGGTSADGITLLTTPYPTLTNGTAGSSSGAVDTDDGAGNTITGRATSLAPLGASWWTANLIVFTGTFDTNGSYYVSFKHSTTEIYNSGPQFSVDDTTLAITMPRGIDLGITDDVVTDIEFGWIDGNDSSQIPLNSIPAGLTFFGPRAGATPFVGVHDSTDTAMAGAMTSLSPTAAPRSPQNLVTITVTGTGFVSGGHYWLHLYRANFSGNPLTQLTYVNATTLTGHVPTAAPLTSDTVVDATLIWRDTGTVTIDYPLATLADAFTFQGQPNLGTLISISPTTRSHTGTATTTVTGSGFLSWADYRFELFDPDTESGNFFYPTYVNATTLTVDINLIGMSAATVFDVTLAFVDQPTSQARDLGTLTAALTLT